MATDAKTGEAIYHGAPSVGLRNVGSYQVSGHPYVTGSGGVAGTAQAARTIKRYQFPFVSKKITVLAQPGNPHSLHYSAEALAGTEPATGSYVWVSFASGSNHDHFSAGELHDHAAGLALSYNSDIIRGNHFIPVTGSLTMEAKVKEIYIIRPDADAATSYRVIAELTNIPTKRMYVLTGSGLTDCPA